MALGTRTLKPGTLISIIGEIYTNHETGTLVLQQDKTNKFLYVEEGRFIFAASSAPEDRFTQILVEKGKLTEDQLKIAQEKRDGRTIGRTLVEMGFLTSGDLLEALVDQMHRIAAGVANWESGRAVFKADVLPKNVAKLPVSTQRLILDTAMAVEDREWAATELNKLEATITMSAAEREAAMGLPLAPHEIRLVETIGGKKNARQICEACNIEVFDGARLLIGLNRLGLCHVRQTFAPAERSSSKSAEEEKNPPLSEEEPQPVSFELAEPEPEETTQTPEAKSEQQEQPEAPPAEPKKSELPFNDETADEAVANETPAPPTASEGKITADWQPGASRSPVEEEPQSEEDSGAEPGKKKGSMKGLGVAFAIIVILAAALAGFWYFYIRKPQPRVSGVIAPKIRKTKPAASATGPGEVAPKKVPPAGVEEKKTAAAKIKTPAGKEPSTRKKPPVKHITPKPIERTPSKASPGAVREAQKLLSEGRYAEAAGVFQKVYSSIPGNYTINVEVACQEETVKKAFDASNGDPAFLVLHYKLGSRQCYRILWGVYRDRTSAEEALKKMPEFLLQDANPKVAHRGR